MCQREPRSRVDDRHSRHLEIVAFRRVRQCQCVLRTRNPRHRDAPGQQQCGLPSGAVERVPQLVDDVIERSAARRRREPQCKKAVRHADVNTAFARSRFSYTLALMASNPSTAARLERLPAVAGRVPPPGSWPVGCRFADRCQHCTEQCTAGPLDLEVADAGSLNPSYSVFWSLAEPLRVRRIADRTEIAARVASTLEAVGLEPDAAHRHPAAFSGGQLQRICVARAIITLPKLVILDKAVSALDLSVQAQILNLLRDLQDERDLSYLFISHDMSVVRHMCHDVTVLYRGQIMASGPTDEVTDAPAHPYTRALMQASPVADPVAQRRRRRAALAEAARPPSTDSGGCIYAPRCPFAMLECHQRRPELREIAPQRFVACHRYPDRTEALDD